MARTAPLPVRDGLNPVRLQMPPDPTGAWRTVLGYLVARFPDDEVRLREKVRDREVVDEIGRPFDETSPLVPGALVYLYRDAPVEARVPFEIDVLHHDDDLLVVDKPHFLASTPKGAYVVESVVVRLRRELGLPEISPAHRLDRVTAGVLVLTTRRELRGAYQQLFAERRVRKTYEAVAGLRTDLSFPLTVRSRIIKQHGILAAWETAGEPNSESRVELMEAREATEARETMALGRYRLLPATGKTHQLRVHMASLGLPIVNDALYPRVLDVASDDYSAPLQLLARSVEFVDPLTGRERAFVSRRELGVWSAGARPATPGSPPVPAGPRARATR